MFPLAITLKVHSSYHISIILSSRNELEIVESTGIKAKWFDDIELTILIHENSKGSYKFELIIADVQSSQRRICKRQSLNAVGEVIFSFIGDAIIAQINEFQVLQRNF